MGGAGVYEIIPGFVVSWVAIYVVSLATASAGEFRPVDAAVKSKA
jgi:SSS family solute:Na+ symporter